MSNKLNPKTNPGQPVVYQIKIEGHLGCEWTDWFRGLTVTLDEDGDTLLTGPVIDQAALHGLLKKVRDLGMPLVSVIQVQFNETHQCLSKKEIKMNTKRKTVTMDRKTLLSTIWIFVVFNYLYCDVISLMDANLLKQYMTGGVGGLEITQGFLLGAGILMEISIAMVLLSRVLKYRANRWANIIAGTITTTVQLLTLFVGSSPTMYYIFFSIIEITCTALIVWYAWKWTNPERDLDNKI